MFGALRLFLASIVAIGHLTPTPFSGIYYGASAVVVFFMLSGYVTAALLAEDIGPGRLSRFYAERAVRLFPLYWAALTLAVVVIAATGQALPLLDPSPSVVAANIVPLPMSAKALFPALSAGGILDPAWSLGLEMQFYLVAPFFLLARWGRVMVAVVAVPLFVLGALAPFGHSLTLRFLPAVAWTFCAGAAIFAARSRQQGWGEVAGYGLLLVVIPIAVVASGSLRMDVVNTLLGFAVGLALIPALSARRSGRLDALLGGASYGVFLLHLPVMWVMDALWPYAALRGPAAAVYVAAMLAGSFAIALALHLAIERPMAAYRQRLRHAAAAQPDASGALGVPRRVRISA